VWKLEDNAASTAFELRHLRHCRQLSGKWRQELNARCKPGITPVVSQNVHGCKSRLTRPQPRVCGYSRASCKDVQKPAYRLHRHPPQVTPCWPARGAEADTRKGGGRYKLQRQRRPETTPNPMHRFFLLTATC